MFARVVEFDTDHLRCLLATEAWQAASQLFLCNQAHSEIARVMSASPENPAGRFWGVLTADGPTVCGFFGQSRVACIAPGSAREAASLRKVALGPEQGFRIVIGPHAVALGFLDSIRDRVTVDLERSQAFLAIEDRRCLGPGIDSRPADARDVEWLVEASITLNEEDLGVPRRSVDRVLLERRVRERASRGTSWIVDVDGKPACKLEIGSDGPAGALIEGVFTTASYRGQGLARRLVADVAGRLLRTRRRVGLHVGRDNAAARVAYEAAGLREVDNLLLALVHWPRPKA
ncbi:MAG: GNAT family N-acetyltransferase [Planctomycetes bacterium]|nr:GNAT family N-acetyltransferase [Planctomycetota bacterium]